MGSWGLVDLVPEGSWRRSKVVHVVCHSPEVYRSGYVQSAVNSREKTLSARQ